jgi:hypothetical protein
MMRDPYDAGSPLCRALSFLTEGSEDAELKKLDAGIAALEEEVSTRAYGVCQVSASSQQ